MKIKFENLGDKKTKVRRDDCVINKCADI